MPETNGDPSAPSTSQPPGNSYLPWHLVPAFRPGETNIDEFSKKLEFLAQIWPNEALPQLAPRVCLMCEGSAFQKVLRLPPEKLKVASTDGCKLVVATLGGVWGRSGVELKFEKFEKAIFGTVQKADESNESYVARHEIHFEELQTMGITIEEMRAYILVRNSNLPTDDRKKIIVDSKGNLVYQDVLSTLKLLGSKFFNEVQGTSKSLGKKTYDINFVDEETPDTSFDQAETIFYTQDLNEEQAFEWLAPEGDEDALVMSQFEDLIIDCIQGDSEAAACLNAYTEARQKLILKAKSRGFWGKGGKDRSKGKGKGYKGSKGFQSNRPSLAQRIAESTCRICNQKGHWKWECPNKDRARAGPSTNPTPSNSQAFAGVTSVETVATAFVAEECIRSHTESSQKYIGGTIRNRVRDPEINNIMRKIIRKAFTQPARQSDVPRRVTEHAKTEHPVSAKPLSSFKTGESNRSDEAAQIFFATQGSFGIVDLGASLSVIGKSQFKELCNNLPSNVIKGMKESPCAVNFRFGNDSVVQGRRAVFIPLGKHWLKVIEVPSNTPFLIANSVFRQFGAQIDTENDSIWFRRLDCTVPIVLSDRKLYLLDVADLISRVNAKVVAAEHVNNIQHDGIDKSKIRNVNKHVKGSHPYPEVLIESESKPKGDLSSEKHSEMNTQKSVSFVEPCPPKWHPIPGFSPCYPPCHVKQQAASSSQSTRREVSAIDCSNIGQQRRPGVREDSRDDTGGVEQRKHQLREDLCGKAFPNHDGRHPLRDVVCEQLQGQPSSQPCQVHPVHPTVRGRHGEEPIAGQVQSLPKSQREECPASNTGILRRESCGSIDSPITVQRRGVRPNGSSPEWKLGGSGATTAIDGDAGHAKSPEPNGRDDATGSSPSEPTSSPESGEVDQSAQPTFDPSNSHNWSEVANVVSQMPSCELDERGFLDNGEFIYLSKKDNWVAREMWEYMESKGLMPNQPCPLKVKSELIEVYCSSESELTRTAQRLGLRATRHGLREGDLTTSEGRHRLYEKLFTELPLHAWMSPKCRAWCRVFNMNRNPKTAVRVMKARKEDLVHLMLCDAIFEFQRWRRCHAHLEQPVGSEMLLQAELQDILDRSLVARCDMCIAGQLSNPETGERIKKGTQVLTTSSLMQSVLNKLRCDGTHAHHQIEGSIRPNGGPRMNLSQFTELYTRVFAHKVIRCMICVRKVQEKPWCEDSALTMKHIRESPDIEVNPKRIKLTVKQPPTLVYRELEQKEKLDSILQDALREAPRVGKRVYQTGDIVDSLQILYPEFTIKCVELCKGTDRFRVPPPGIQSSTAPHRLSVGIHRNTVGNFCEPWEEWSKLSRRQLTRHSPPARLLMTVFAKKKTETTSEPDSKSSSVSRLEVNEPPSKRHKGEIEEKEPFDIKGKIETTHSHQDHGPLFRSLPPQEREALLRLHKNLGHPDTKVFRNSLMSQGWSKEIIKGIEDMHCPACHESQQPKLSRPSHLSNPKQFNEVVSIDEVIWTSQHGTQFHFYHMLDTATNFQIAFQVDNRTSSCVWKGIRDNWIRWAGSPGQLMCDSAGEFCSEEFSKHLQQFDIKSTVIPAEAHWQMGKCERHGAILQHMLNKYQIDHTISNDEEFRDALTHCTNAKNSISRHRGYSPEILVLGKSRLEIGSNSQSEWNSGDWNHMPGEIGVFHQNLTKRASAQKAFIDADTDLKLRRALQHRARPSRGPFEKDQWAMFWRAGKGNLPGNWNGPARVVLVESDQLIWVTHMSRLYRCAPEHLRNLSSREYSLIDENYEHPHILPENFGTGVFQYQDLTHQNAVSQADPESNPFPTNEVIPPPVNQHDMNDGQIPSEGSVIQPDSEPDQASETPAEATDASQIPIPDQPFSEEEQGNESDAFRAESKVFDHWVIVGRKVIRMHSEPRLHLFHPGLVNDCPVDSSNLKSLRKSVVKIPGQPEAIVKDHWKDNIEAHQSMCNAWTGQTIFEISDDQPTPEHTVNSCLQESEIAYEIGIDLEEHEILSCTRMTHQDQVNFLASAAKRQKVEVKEKDLSESDRKLFLKAKEKEISSWLSTETVRKIARNQIPQDQILRSRWVLTWKPIEQSHTGDILNPTHKPKARLVILGYEDPHLESLNRDSPTMGRDSRTLVLQHAASAKWRISAFDIQTAFLRGSRQDGRILGMEPPKEMRTTMQLQPWECCELLKSAYGLVNAPLLWYIELMKNALVSYGMQVSPFDPCIFVLPKTKGKGIHGILGIHVDDGLMAGDSEFHNIINQLERKYPFGSKSSNDFVFTGIHIHQNDDHSIELDQTKYIEDIVPIQVDRNRRQDQNQLVNEKERQELRGLIGSLQYATTNTRPDLAAKVSFVQSKITTACISDLLEANRILQEAKQTKETKIVIKSIPLEDLRFVSFSDASFATRSKSQSQKGCLILAASKQIGEWQASDVSPLMWYSRKIARVVASTLASETYALSGAIDLLGWLRLHWMWMCEPSNLWKQPEQALRLASEAYAVVDCKSLFDLLQKTTIPQCQEYRTMLEALVIKDRVKEGIIVKWVHSAAQLADTLTKVMDGSNFRSFLEKGKCIIHDVDEILRERADKKARKQWSEQPLSSEDMAIDENVDSTKYCW